MQLFDDDQTALIAKGKTQQQLLRSQLHEALHNNRFGSNYIFSSKPGLGKSFETDAAIKGMPNIAKFTGSSSFAGLVIEIAYSVRYAIENNTQAIIVFDDCDVLFHRDNIDAAKKMFDDEKVLRYGKLPTQLKANATPDQLDALNSFANVGKVGFSIPLDNTTCIILTNLHLPTINEVSRLDQNSSKYILLNSMHAIRRRNEYKEIEMTDNELWGYVANVVLNEKICEKFHPTITQEEKGQLLTWCYTHWSKVSERNLSLIEKMTKDMVRYAGINYLNIWKSNYL